MSHRPANFNTSKNEHHCDDDNDDQSNKNNGMRGDISKYMQLALDQSMLSLNIYHLFVAYSF